MLLSSSYDFYGLGTNIRGNYYGWQSFRLLFPPEVRPVTRVNKSTNHHPFNQLSVSNNVYKYCFPDL